ncbi:MAG: hypothetical protein Q9172_003529 [Xanthocarpia lactea]
MSGASTAISENRVALQGDALDDQRALATTQKAVIDELNHQAAHQWDAASIAGVLEAGYDEHPARSYGVAVECPSLVGRKRYTLCLCTTDVKAVKEDDLDLKDHTGHEYEELMAGAMEEQDDSQDKEVFDPNGWRKAGGYDAESEAIGLESKVIDSAEA